MAVVVKNLRLSKFDQGEGQKGERLPAADKSCASCKERGRTTQTIAYKVGGDIIHHCPWHNSEVRGV